MIVICTKCQAKFRVADDKIGPRGAKVRCSKCQTVFLVHPDLGTIPVTDGDARPAVAKPVVAPHPGPPRAAVPAAAPPPSDPFGDADPFAGSSPAAPDPFSAAPSAGSFAIPEGEPDPFAAVVAAADPFARSAPPPLPPAARDPFGSDPFAAPPEAAAAPAPGLAAADPFAAPSPPRSTLPVTDLSDLLGGVAPGAPPPAPSATPPSDPFGVLPFAPEPDAAPPAPGLAEPADDGGLALEDRLTPAPVQVKLAPPPIEEPLEIADAARPGPQLDPFASFVPVPAAGLAAEPFLDGTEAPPLDAAGPAFELAAGDAVPAARAAPPRPDAPPARVGAAAVAAAAPQASERIPGARTSRLRAVAVNAVALVALLVVALTLWALWRTEGPLEAASFRPSAILAALGRGGGRAGAWATHDVRSGFYDRERGAPLLFVRGRVVSGAPSAVSAVKVEVEVVRDGQVLARGEAIAGAVPTAEELYGAGDDAALSAAVRAARRRAPAQIRPGDAVPFLVAIGGASTELEGATLRIGVAPAPGGVP